jgi:hypothetical protein
VHDIKTLGIEGVVPHSLLTSAIERIRVDRCSGKFNFQLVFQFCIVIHCIVLCGCPSIISCVVNCNL